jgi:MFS family permease
MQTFGIFAAGYLARPLGGIVMAHFGDLLGRKKMFTLSIFMMAVPTLIMGLLPTYAQIGMWAPILLLLMRVIQGAAIGGEVPGRGSSFPNTYRKSTWATPAAPSPAA